MKSNGGVLVHGKLLEVRCLRNSDLLVMFFGEQSYATYAYVPGLLQYPLPVQRPLLDCTMTKIKCQKREKRTKNFESFRCMS